MIDLETMGTSNNAAIVAIGACEFDWTCAINPIGRTFYKRIDLVDAAKYGVIDAATVIWWLEQAHDAQAELYGEGRYPLVQALGELNKWFDDPNYKVWGNGATFDNVILRNAYTAAKVVCPWQYRNDGCFRTMKNMLAKPDQNLLQGGLRHHALDDAVRQAQYLINAVRLDRQVIQIDFTKTGESNGRT